MIGSDTAENLVAAARPSASPAVAARRGLGLLDPAQQQQQGEQEARRVGDVGRRQTRVADDRGYGRDRERRDPRRRFTVRAAREQPGQHDDQRQERQHAGASQREVADVAGAGVQEVDQHGRRPQPRQVGADADRDARQRRVHRPPWFVLHAVAARQPLDAGGDVLGLVGGGGEYWPRPRGANQRHRHDDAEQRDTQRRRAARPQGRRPFARRHVGDLFRCRQSARLAYQRCARAALPSWRSPADCDILIAHAATAP